jgi:hypothetical protein
MSATIITGILILGGTATWGYVVLRLAKMGTEHPEHQGFYIKLARSKKLEIPSSISSLFNNSKKENENDDKEN